jgi:Gram-negative bacterial TonB protein C-terminal
MRNLLFVALVALSVSNASGIETDAHSPTYSRIDLSQCALHLQSAFSGKPPKFATLIRFVSAPNGNLTHFDFVSASGSAEFDEFLETNLRRCPVSVFGSLSRKPASSLNREGYLMVAVPESMLPPEYRTLDPSKCKISRGDYPLEARRQNAEGTIHVEFVTSSSGRVALAQLRSLGPHPTLELASFTILTRCIFPPPADGRSRISTMNFQWKLE